MKALSLAPVRQPAGRPARHDDARSRVDTEIDPRSLDLQTLVPEVALVEGKPVWVGLHFPNLALDVCIFDKGLPSVVLDDRQRVHAACTVAMDHGITPGMSLNAAHALCRNLSIRLRDPEAEYQRLCRFSEQLQVFTPHLALGKWRSAVDQAARKGAQKNTSQVTGAGDNADSLLLEVSGSLRLFGGLSMLLERIQDEFADHEAPPVLCAASCPAAALVLTRNGHGGVVLEADSLRTVLGEMTLDCVDLEPKLIARLQRCGLRQVHDLWRMPRKDLGRRFGADLLAYLDRLSDHQVDPVAYRAPAHCFRQRIALPVDTRHSKLIVIAAERLLGEARRFLEMHAAATEQVRFDLWHVNRAYGSRSRTTFMVRSGQADRQPGRFLPQFEEQLGRLAIEQEVDAVSILIDQVVPLQRGSEDLFTRRDQQTEDWTQLIDLLGARLGSERVYTLASGADYRPEKAWRKTDRQAERPGTLVDDQVEAVVKKMAERPLWLLSQPRELARNAVTLHGEVERIEAGWWERRDVRRDYQIASARREGEGWGWVYRNLRDEGCESGWYLHGLFG